MIRSITLQNEASYGSTPQHLKDLSKHNFIFGANATGKTTISRVIANASDYPHCPVTWVGGTEMETLVYNRDFVDKNFDQPAELRGIFTLGEKNKDVIASIAAAKSQLDNLAKKILGLRTTLCGEHGNGGKRSELKELEVAFAETCWELKKKHEPKLTDAFTGYRHKKTAFKTKLLAEAKSNRADAHPLIELEERAKIVFGETPAKASPIPLPVYEDLVKTESNPLLSKNIVGKSDVDIAAMIQKLANSDWVKQGRVFYDVNNGVCPFCQQETDDSLADSLDAYFDETFESETKAIKRLHDDYEASSRQVTDGLMDILKAPGRFLDADEFRSKKELLESTIRANVLLIQAKCDEPSKRVELHPLADQSIAVNDTINAANRKIEAHNAMVLNLDRERSILTAQVWKTLLEHEIKSDLSTYEKKKKGLEDAIASLTNSIALTRTASEEIEAEIRRLEKTTTSIQPTIDRINGILGKFGFTNFTLAKSRRETCYTVRRSDGRDAKQTLSEGEKSFITFLYFYHLLKGSETESGMTTDRVVVFDDPVSSMDSDVVFIVSTLIRALLEEVQANTGHIKQIFVLTHNVFFHREVAFDGNRPNNGTMNRKTFWIVRKRDESSVLKRHDVNPIRTSYELLWMEVRNPDRSNLFIQNTLRRILESYFKILGNVDHNKTYSCFDGAEKLVCKSLFSWVNAGSHLVDDDLYVSVDGASVDSFLAVFRKVFEKLGHAAHYDMMMGGAQSIEEA